MGLGWLGEALGVADDLVVAVLVHADRHHRRNVLVGAALALLEVDAVDVDVRMGAGRRPTSLLVGRFERLLVRSGDRAGGDAGAPRDLADVLDAARRYPGQAHLNDGLLDAGFAPLVALDDRDGEAQALELRHLERDLARRRGEAALVMVGAISGALVGELVGSGADEPVGLLAEWCDWVGHGVISGMIERVAQVVSTACAMSFLFWVCLAFRVCKEF